MAIKISDLEQDQSLLVELGEKDANKVCGGASAVDQAIQSAKASTEEQTKLSESLTKTQQQLSAAQVAASLDQAVSRNVSQSAQKIQ
jgi:hypothetical protein